MKIISFVRDFVLVAFCLISVIVAAPPLFLAQGFPSPPRPIINYASNDARILKYENENLAFGGYKYAYEQSDGTRAEQVGKIKDQGTENELLVVSGQFRWVSPEGIGYIVRYTADENGYKPEIERESLLPSQGYSNEYQQAPRVENYVASLIG